MSKFRHTRTRFKRAGELLPRHSNLASWILPALILREDLYFEWRHIGASDEKVSVIADSSNIEFHFYARSYFFRGSMRSIYSAKVVLQALRGMPELVELLRARDRFDEFQQCLTAVHKATQEFTSLRHRFGGHVEKDVHERREHINDDELLPLSWERGVDGVRFSDELAHRILLACVADKDEKPADVEARLQRLADATLAAFRALNLVVTTYFEKAW
ncbi:MAG: hypothetical protein LUO89_03040 [Methanothrix sp.]|nr:hypothetical protein [Methanothrix sp.]